MSTAKNWVRADVTYLGKGSYTRGKKFLPNKTLPVDNRELADYLKDFPFFSVRDVFVDAEPESLPVGQPKAPGTVVRAKVEATPETETDHGEAGEAEAKPPKKKTRAKKVKAREV